MRRNRALASFNSPRAHLHGGLFGMSIDIDLSLTSMTGLGLVTSPFIVERLSGLSSYITGGDNPTIVSVSVDEGENTSSKALK